MRASAQWWRRLSERYAPRQCRRGVMHLRNYSCEYMVAGDGEPLLLVPGLAGGFELVGRLIQSLADHFQVISYQLRGERDPLLARQPHGFADLADDLADLQDALLLEYPVVLGVSFGSAVALEFVMRYPHRARALVLHGIEARFRQSLGGRIARLALEEFPLPHDNPFFNQFFRLLFARRELAGPLVDFVTEQCWSTEQIAMGHRMALLAGFDVRNRLSSVTAPTLIVAGQDDSIVSPSRQLEMAHAIHNSQFISLPGAGHLCFLTQPRAFTHAVLNFLRPCHTLAS